MFVANPTRARAIGNIAKLNKLIEPINAQLKTKFTFDSYSYDLLNDVPKANIRNKSNQKRIRLNTDVLLKRIEENSNFLKELVTSYKIAERL